MRDIKLNIDYFGRLGVAVSGGRDSMALLHIIMSRLDRKRILVINIEHGIRGVKSREESKFVLEYCDKENIECVSIPVDALAYAKENKLTLEQAARELRYREFNRLIDERRVSKIALAHHKGDQAETVMMRILRGTGINGLSGMSEESERFIRPLINYSRKEINHYIKTENIPYVDDDSNFNNDYTRNFIRNKLFPEIQVKFPDYENALIRLSRNAREDNDYLMSLTVKPEITGNTAILPISALLGPPPLVSRSIMLCFQGLDVHADIERRHIDVICGMTDLNNGDSLNMPYEVKVYREYDKLVFVRWEPEKVNETIEFTSGSIRAFGLIIEVGEFQGEGLKFDLDKVPPGAVIRFRREGDYFSKFGGGTKSLSDYMTDIKIPRRLRNHIPLVAKDGEILIITGYEISSKIAVDNQTKKIYTITAGEEK